MSIKYTVMQFFPALRQYGDVSFLRVDWSGVTRRHSNDSENDVFTHFIFG